MTGRPEQAAGCPRSPAAGRDGTAGEPGFDELIRVPTAERMRALGCRLARVLRAGDLVLLSGPLGAGKTTLAQGIGAGLGVRGPVTSPTFVIARVHPSLSAGPDLVHADAYRLGSRAEVDDLDLDAGLATAVTVVEWGEGLVEDLAPSFLSVIIRADVPSAERARSGTAQAGTGETGTGETGTGETGTGEAGTGETGTGETGTGEAGTLRTVRVRGWGERWRGAAVADATRLALADLS